MKKNLIIVTGGAGFVGSHMIELLLKKTKNKILSIDNYSTGKRKNHIKHNRVKYIKSNTKNISKTLKLYKKKISTIFHFGEFSRIYQSFIRINECFESNTIGTKRSATVTDLLFMQLCSLSLPLCSSLLLLGLEKCTLFVGFVNLTVQLRNVIDDFPQFLNFVRCGSF